MKYRGIECAVIQDVDRGTWSWTVNLINETESGLRKSREGALTAMDSTKGLALKVHPRRKLKRGQ